MMTFEEFWYDYKVKNGLSGLAIAKMEIARDAWFAGQAQINEVWNQSDAIARPEDANLEAQTFIDAVSAMGFPKGWEHVAEEARRIRALRVPQEQEGK